VIFSGSTERPKVDRIWPKRPPCPSENHIAHFRIELVLAEKFKDGSNVSSAPLLFGCIYEDVTKYIMRKTSRC
jgi:hypothetical protein